MPSPDRLVHLGSLYVSFLLLAAIPAHAATIRVPADQPTIQAGIDAASPGDVVLVAPGNYIGAGNKNLDFRGKDIETRSEAGAELTIIDCEGSGRGFFLVAPITAAARVSGFTIQNGAALGGEGGGGMVILAASPTIEHCIFRNNRAFGGILLGGGGALACHVSSSSVTDCVFDSNVAYGLQPGGGAIRGISSTLAITGCLFTNNLADGGSGGGIQVDRGTSYGHKDSFVAFASIIRCRFDDNSASSGGAVYATHALTIEESTIFGNSGSPSAIWCIAYGGGAPTIIRSTIVGNRSTEGACVFVASHAIIENSIIAFNDGLALEAGYDCLNIEDIRCTDISSNSLGDWAGCLGRFLGQEGNISEDPLFCDVQGGDLRLAEGSPCAPEHSGTCGLIGAWPVGCGATAVDPATWGAIKAKFEGTSKRDR